MMAQNKDTYNWILEIARFRRHPQFYDLGSHVLAEKPILEVEDSRVQFNPLKALDRKPGPKH